MIILFLNCIMIVMFVVALCAGLYMVYETNYACPRRSKKQKSLRMYVITLHDLEVADDLTMGALYRATSAGDFD